MVIGFADAPAVWRLFAAAARWTNHVRQHGGKEPELAQEIKDDLVRAVTAWYDSARTENPRPGTRSRQAWPTAPPSPCGS